MSLEPKVKKAPPYRSPTNILDPSSFDKKSLRIHFDLLDFHHGLWGWNLLSQQQHIDFLKFIQAMEKQTWAEIKMAAGGRRRGTNHHPLEINKFNTLAQKRLKELNLYDIVGDSLFSLRMNNVTRLYGVREEAFFRPIWHDPHHDHPKKAAYPINC